MSVAVDTDAILTENVVAPLADDQNAIPAMEGNPDGLNDASSAPKQTQEVDPLTLLKQQANTTIDNTGHQVDSILEEKPSDATAIETSLIDEDIQPIELTAESKMNGMNGQLSVITPVEGPTEVVEANAEVPQIAATTTNGDPIAPASDQAMLESDPGRSSPGDQNHIEALPADDAAAENTKEDIKGEAHSVVENSAESQDAVKESSEGRPPSFADEVKVADDEEKLVEAVSADVAPLYESGGIVTEEPAAVAATTPQGSESSVAENSPSGPAPANSTTDTISSAQVEEPVPGSAESEGEPQDASAEATQKSSVAAVEEPSATEVKSEQLKEQIAIFGQPGESKDGKLEVADEVVEENVESQSGAMVPSQDVEDILVEETRVDVEKPIVEDVDSDVENNTVNIEATPKAAPDAVTTEESTVTSVDNQTDQLIAEENQHPATAADEHARSDVAEATVQPEENSVEEPGVFVEEVPAGAEAVIHETEGIAGHSSVDQATAVEDKLEESVPVVESSDPSLGPKHEDAAPESAAKENSPATEILESQAEAPVEEPIKPAAVQTVMIDSVPLKPAADAAQEESSAVIIATEDPVVETKYLPSAAEDTASAPKNVQEDTKKPEDDVSVSPSEVDAPVETPAEVISQPEERVVVVDPVANDAASVLQLTHGIEPQDHAAAQPVVEKGDEIPPAEVSDQVGYVSSPKAEVAEADVDVASVPAETNVEDVISTTEESASEPALTTAEEPPAAVDTDATPALEQPSSAEVMAEAPVAAHVEELPKEDVLEGVTAALESATSVESATHEEPVPAAKAEVTAEVQEPSVESSEIPTRIEHVVSADEVSSAPESHKALASESQVAEEVAPELVHEDALTEKLPTAEIANSEEKVEAAEVDSQIEPEPEAVAEPAAAEEPAKQPEAVQDAAPETVKVHDAVEEAAEAPAAAESSGAEAPAQGTPSETISITPVPAEEASVEPAIPASEPAAVEEKIDGRAVVEPESAPGEAAQHTEDTLEPALEAAPAFEGPEVAVEEESVAPAPSLAEEQRLHSEVEVAQKVLLDVQAVAEETATVPEATEPVAEDAQRDVPSVEAVADTNVETIVVEQPAEELIPTEQPVQNQPPEESAPLAVVDQEPQTEDAPEEPHVKDVKVEEAQVAQDNDVPADIEKLQEITEVTTEPAVPEISQELVPVEEAPQSELTTDQISVCEPSVPMMIQEEDLAKGENGQEEKVETVRSTQDTSEITSTEEIVKEAPEVVTQIDETPAVPVDIVKEPETAAAERADAIETTPTATQLEQSVEASEPVEAADETEAAKIEQAEGTPLSNDVASDTLSAQPELSLEAGSDDIAERETQMPASENVPQTELVIEEAENQDAGEAAQEIVEPLTEDMKPIATEQPLLEASEVEPKASEVIPVAPEVSFTMDKISLPTSVEGDAAMEAAEDLTEDIDQKLDANEEIFSSSAEEAAIPVSTDLATTGEASATVDVADETVLTTEQTKDDGLNADVMAHIERPKSPWTPSFQVTTVGGGATPPEEPEKPEDHVLVGPAEDAPASAGDVVNASETPQPAEDLPAEPAQSATPQLVLDTSSLEPEVPEAIRPWTPSYSVHSQGSPRLELSEVTAIDAPDEPEESPRPWTTTYPAHTQGSPQHVSQEFAQQGATVKDESEGLAREGTSAEVPEEVRDKGLGSTVEQHSVIEEASAEGEIPAVAEVVKPMEDAPVVEEVEHVDKAPVVEQVGHVGEAQTVQEVESTAKVLAVDLGITLPESENQLQEAQIVDLLALHETVDENGLEDVNATEDVPKLVVATGNEASKLDAGASEPTKDGTDRTKSPSWVPSYSVSVQGSPLQEAARLGEEPLADVENVVKLADAAPAATGALSFVRSDVHLDEHQVASGVAKGSSPTVSAADEVFDRAEKETAPHSDAKVETTEIPPIVTDSVSLETPQNTERPKSPWTPSYSVTVQGAGQNADEELDTLEPLPQRAVPLPDGPALTKKDDIPNELGARLAFSHSTETFVTAIEVPDEMKTSIASLKPADKTEDNATRSLASKEQNQEAFPSVEDAVDGQKLSRLNVSRLVSVSETERSDVTSATTEATSSSPSTRKRLESTTSSRFFPGGWTSTAAKTVGEGRTSLEIAQGEFISGKAPSTISTGDVPDVPEGSGGSTANESSDDSDDESEESVHETKRRWCIVM